MNTSTSRRTFLQKTVSAGLALGGWQVLGSRAARAADPIKHSGPPRLYLSMAAYSFRQYFTHADPAKRITLFDFIDYCANHGCVGTELTSYYFPKSVTHEYLLQLRRHTFVRGIPISGTAVGNNFALPKGPKREEQIALVKEWVDKAAVMFAPHIRVFAGPVTAGQTKEDAKKLCVEALEECAEYAGRKGIFLGLENHGGIVAEPGDLLDIVRAVQSPWLGVNLDTGNFNTDDPYRDLAAIAPYAVNVQYKSEITYQGKKKQLADLGRLTQILKQANYQGFVALEYEADTDPYEAVPGLLKSMKALLEA